LYAEPSFDKNYELRIELNVKEGTNPNENEIRLTNFCLQPPRRNHFRNYTYFYNFVLEAKFHLFFTSELKVMILHLTAGLIARKSVVINSGAVVAIALRG
jgi:hypothetical protein